MSGFGNFYLQISPSEGNFIQKWAKGDEGLSKVGFFHFSFSLPLIEGMDNTGGCLEGALNPMAMKFRKLLSQGKVKSMMDRVEGGFLVGD